jgi:hypothetical protein
MTDRFWNVALPMRWKCHYQGWLATEEARLNERCKSQLAELFSSPGFVFCAPRILFYTHQSTGRAAAERRGSRNKKVPV